MSLRALLWKDLRVEMRGKEGLQAGLVLVALFFLVDLFAFEGLAGEDRAAAVVLWTPLVFATVAALGRGLAAEADRGTLELLRTAPVEPGLHGVSRTLVNLLLAGLLLAAALGLAALVFDVPLGWPLVLLLAACAVGLAVTGTLAGAIAAQTRAREILLPILLVPVAAPLVQAGVRGTLDALAGATVPGLRVPLLLVLGYDLLLAGAAWFLWPVVLEVD